MPKATRITVVSDAEYVGEKYPFYNTFADPEKDPEMEPHPFLKNKQRKKLFNPSVCYLLIIELNIILILRKNLYITKLLLGVILKCLKLMKIKQ